MFEVHTVMSKVVGDAERKNLAQYPGGIMFELGCHVIDLVVGVLGKPDKIHAFPRHSGKQNDGLLDNINALRNIEINLRAVPRDCPTEQEATAWVRQNLGPGDAVLYENDLPDHFA